MNETTILIIDDDSRNVFALSAVLRSRGFAVRSASSVSEGMDILKQESGIKVVLLDMMMPDIDGYAALALFKQDEQLNNIPVFAVTAQAMTGDRERCLEAGADEYISKPIDVDVLLHLLKTYKVMSRNEG